MSNNANFSNLFEYQKECIRHLDKINNDKKGVPIFIPMENIDIVNKEVDEFVQSIDEAHNKAKDSKLKFK